MAKATHRFDLPAFHMQTDWTLEQLISHLGN